MSIMSDSKTWRDKTNDALERLQRRVNDYADTLSKIEGDERFTPEHKSQLRAEAHAAARQDALSIARRARKRLEKELDALGNREADAWRKQSEGIDWPQVQARAAEFRMTLGREGDEAFGGQSPVQAAFALRDRMLKSGDVQGLRALRVAVSERIDAWQRNDALRMQAAELDQVLERDATPQEIVAIEAERDQVGAALIETDRHISNAARVIDPSDAQNAMYSGQRSAFLLEAMGRSSDPFSVEYANENGGGVVFRGSLTDDDEGE